MTDWIGHLRDAKEGAVLVTVIAARGSVPREVGVKMVVGPERIYGTIGGGTLEYEATKRARSLLGRPQARIEKLHLGPDLGQCCGGHMTVLIEAPSPAWWPALDAVAAPASLRTAVLVTAVPGDGAFSRKMLVTAAGAAGSLGGDGLDGKAAEAGRAMLHEGARAPRLTRSEDGTTLFHEPVRDDRFDLVLFGAGHVGRAVVEVMAGLACRITWIDGRAHELPASVPANVAVRISPAPAGEVAGLPHDACWLVMTHSHDLDFELCARVLERGGFRYLGLIGSQTKRARFHKRLIARGIAPEALTRLTCPIGVAGIAGKHPREIAIAVAAEILQVESSAGERGALIAETGRAKLSAGRAPS